MRPVALRVKQRKPILGNQESLPMMFIVSIAGKQQRVEWKFKFRHHRSTTSLWPFRITFAPPSAPINGPPAVVSYAMVVPPTRPASNTSNLPPVILATHGAGVDIENPCGPARCPLVLEDGLSCRPGRTSWGEDWHDSSMADAWAARDILPTLLGKLGIHLSNKTLLIGHSNGGQGAWHLAARYPDRIVGGEERESLYQADR